MLSVNGPTNTTLCACLTLQTSPSDFNCPVERATTAKLVCLIQTPTHHTEQDCTFSILFAAYPTHRSLTHTSHPPFQLTHHTDLSHTSHPPLQLALTRLHFAPDFEGLQIALQLWQDGAGTSPLNSCSYIEVCVCVCVCVCALACTRVCL